MSSSKRRVAQSAAMIAMATLFSKFLGFLREVLIASKFGSGYETDTYFVAMTATVLIMTTIGTALKTTLIPIFSEIQERKGKNKKLDYMTNVLNVIFIITILLVIVGYFVSPFVVKILAKGFTGEQYELAIKLNRIGLPIIIFLGLSYVFSGFLESNEVFGPPAIAGIPFNLVYIVYLLTVSQKLGIIGLMVTSVIASAAQWLIQIPAAKRLGFKYSLKVDLKDRYIEKALMLTAPVLLGSAVQQINVIIDRTLASSLKEGSISALNYATRVNDMIISVFVMAITTVIFPMLSKAFTRENLKEAKDIMEEGINIILIITVPATIGIIILAEPAIKVFFERGAFDSQATSMTSSALLFYSLGLIASSLRLMLNKVFYSIQDTSTPMINGAIAVGINVALNYILIRYMAHSGLALATSISSIVTTILLFISLRKKIGSMGIKSYIICFIKTLIASIIMGLVVYGIYFKFGSLFPNKSIIELLLLILAVSVGVLIYFVLCCLLRVKEMRTLLGRLKKSRK
ncbi:murein biosynthesis integral membrane protein MurJ [Anaerosalibacter massiliensis]|uniref:Probable lipid II flippase MurJ n=1 Tax=Anaerosalibacter massiliensis TaxID=1347392 RepID=A0A9X2MIS3_9FIRM|nr:murein biosynthesis integral membrane protein MurJ [Anaerosalibacter massiliensis]MCR2044484.1 murein biosynthesis integral membrane protein MurJ [Anaerosalibacter massiliensis]